MATVAVVFRGVKPLERSLPLFKYVATELLEQKEPRCIPLPLSLSLSMPAFFLHMWPQRSLFHVSISPAHTLLTHIKESLRLSQIILKFGFQSLSDSILRNVPLI